MIPKEKIAQETWNWCISLFEDKEAQFPGFMNMIRRVIPEEGRVEQIVENPAEMSEFLISEEELQLLITANIGDNEALLM